MSLEVLLEKRDKQEYFKNRYFPNHLPEIERHDEIDYEITQLLSN